MKKNCHTCEHLAWEDGDVGDPSGYTCYKRCDESYEKEREMHRKLDKKEYRLRGKRCWEPIQNN